MNQPLLKSFKIKGDQNQVVGFHGNWYKVAHGSIYLILFIAIIYESVNLKGATFD